MGWERPQQARRGITDGSVYFYNMAYDQKISKADLENMGIDPADMEAILKVAQEEGGILDVGVRDQMNEQMGQSRAICPAGAEELRRLRDEQEERELQEALALSAETPVPEPNLMDDEDSIQRALRESEEEAKAAEARRQERMRSEDEGELFQAALRASRVDLGPRGISQAAKIMATGDAALGQASIVAKTGTHSGAGARFNRSSAATRSTSSLQHAGATAAAGAGAKAAEGPAAAGSEDGAGAPPGRGSARGGGSVAASAPSASASLRGAGISLAAAPDSRTAGGPAPKSLARVSVPSSSVAGTGAAELSAGPRNGSASGKARPPK